MGYKEFAASIFGKFGGNKNKQATEPLTVYAPFSGNAIALEEIPDPVFSQGILGQGCGMEPAEETVCAPFNGTVTQVIDTKHAVGVTSKDGLELLIHVGMDTVDMKGQGFTCHVKEGDSVKLGQKLITFSMEAPADSNRFFRLENRTCCAKLYATESDKIIAILINLLIDPNIYFRAQVTPFP